MIAVLAAAGLLIYGFQNLSISNGAGRHLPSATPIHLDTAQKVAKIGISRLFEREIPDTAVNDRQFPFGQDRCDFVRSGDFYADVQWSVRGNTRSSFFGRGAGAFPANDIVEALAPYRRRIDVERHVIENQLGARMGCFSSAFPDVLDGVNESNTAGLRQVAQGIGAYDQGGPAVFKAYGIRLLVGGGLSINDFDPVPSDNERTYRREGRQSGTEEYDRLTRRKRCRCVIAAVLGIGAYLAMILAILWFLYAVAVPLKTRWWWFDRFAIRSRSFRGLIALSCLLISVGLTILAIDAALSH